MPTGGGQETAQTLNAILVEMDGFDSSDQVIVIAATNRMDVLDPALTRPGRFDRQIEVPLPDLKGRCEILQIYADKVKCGPDVDLKRLARGTPMFSGADLAALVNEAAIMATMADKEFVEQADLEDARDKVRWGRARKNRVIDEKEKEITAYHEAGHALVQSLLPDADPLHKVSIIPRGSMGGATFSLPEKDRYFYSRSYCRALLVTLFGGRLAEENFIGEIHGGAYADIKSVTNIARMMVTQLGMSEALGPISYDEGQEQVFLGRDYGRRRSLSERTQQLIDDEVTRIINEQLERARSLITEHRAETEIMGEALLERETLTRDEVEMIMAGTPLPAPEISLPDDDASDDDVQVDEVRVDDVHVDDDGPRDETGGNDETEAPPGEPRP